MASPTTPVHGKYGPIYRQRPNNFKGSGLNDLTLGTGATNAATAYYEIVIDSELGGGGGVDTFKWRKNGGGWTTDVDITGAAQTLDEGQTITFAATTGHTLADQWTIGNLIAEPTTESGATAQITDATHRILNPNSPPTFTDDGGANVVWIDYASGTAHFDANVGNVTVAGNNGFIVESGLQKEGYLIDWSMNINLDMADISSQGDAWKTAIPGMGGGNGSANKYLIANQSFWEDFEDNVDGTQKYYLLKLFNYDPDQDETGDHYDTWVTFTSFGVNPSIGDVVKETVNFQILGKPVFTANT